MVTRTDVLNQAQVAISERNTKYGEPENNFARIATIWQAWLTIRKPGPLNSADVAIMMGQMKAARLANDPTHQDSWVDIAGYAACGAEISSA